MTTKKTNLIVFPSTYLAKEENISPSSIQKLGEISKTQSIDNIVEFFSCKNKMPEAFCPNHVKALESLHNEHTAIEKLTEELELIRANIIRMIDEGKF